MEKTRLDLEMLLPEVPDERDACVARIIHSVETKKGVSKVHFIPEDDGAGARLCFHYDPGIISIKQVQRLAKHAGAALTAQYGHALIEVEGIRHPRQARIIEAGIKASDGVINVSVAGTGFIQVEYFKEKLSEEKLLDEIRKLNLKIVNVEGFPAHAHPHQAGKKPGDAHAGHDHGSKTKKGEHDHGQAHEPFGEKTELIFSIICGVFLALGFVLSFISGISPVVIIILYLISYFFGGFYTTKEAISGIARGEFEIDFLMLVAAIGAAVLGEWAEGALLLFLFSLGHSLEHHAMQKAKKSIAALTGLTPKTALLKTGTSLKEVSIEALEPGNIILVKPNAAIAADGYVINGSSSVNQAPITGESIPVDKSPAADKQLSVEDAAKLDEKHKVFAGSINGGETLEIRVTRIAEDSTIARLVKLVNEAQTQKSTTQHLTDKIERFYVPAVLVLVMLLLFAFVVVDEPFSSSFYRSMAVLVAASPCALAISTPSAVLSGVARAARSGVLIKGGKALETLGSVTTVAFDKTGTLTEGKPVLTGVYPLNGVAEDELLAIVIAVEKLSEHPLAAALVKGATAQLKRDVPPASGLRGITGRGVKAEYDGTVVHIGNKELFLEKDNNVSGDIMARVEKLESEGNTTMLVQRNESFVGMVTLLDKARADASSTIRQLPALGIKKMVMLTGDNQRVADAIARETGITEARGNLLPEEKMAAIEELKATGKGVAMVGDGVNDAPAMAKSSVGIAMGAAGSDVALETADVALMANELGKLPFAIGLSKKANTIIRQNLFISMGMVVILIPLTITGIAHIGPAVIGHEGSTLLVVFNALRLLGYKVDKEKMTNPE